jgi:hypothetical protein
LIVEFFSTLNICLAKRTYEGESEDEVFDLVDHWLKVMKRTPKLCENLKKSIELSIRNSPPLKINYRLQCLN